MRISLGMLREYLGEHWDILIEGRVEDAREKFPDMEDESFDYLVANQPPGSNNKYLLWCCKQVDEGFTADVTIQAVRLFDGNKQRLEKKDLYQYEEVGDVTQAIEKLGGASKNQKAKKAKADSDLIYNDERFTVIRPHTMEAACKYGAGTKWCIAATGSYNYFPTYATSNNKFYFIIDKSAPATDPNAKLALVIKDINTPREHLEVYNTPDSQVGIRTLVSHTGPAWEEIWKKIEEHVKANPDSREVEDARKDTEEHVRGLLAGENISGQAMKKIANDGTLTTPVISALLAKLGSVQGTLNYNDPRADIIPAFARRASQLSPDGAMLIIRYMESKRPPGNAYWDDSYRLRDILKGAPLTPENFRTLAEQGDDVILSNIISNPNAPPDILETMAARINTIRDKYVRLTVFKQLMKTGTITPDQMRTAMTDSDLRHDVLQYEELTQNLSPDILRLIPLSNDNSIKKFLALSNITPEIAADVITTNLDKIRTYDLNELLKTVSLPMSGIETIWSAADASTKTALLQNPSVGIDNIKKFAQSQKSAFRFAIAHNPAAPGDVLQALAGDESSSTRSAVAAHPNTPPETLRVLASNEATAVRASVASNGSTPIDVLNVLRKDSDSFIRRSAIKTLKTKSATEAIIREMMSMRSILLREELEDNDENEIDIMNPGWRNLPPSVGMFEFVTVFLLQNNGTATREEIADAYQTWRGVAGAKQLWNRSSEDRGGRDDIIRGISAGGRGWFWSPPGINKGAMFRLTPAGASVAMKTLNASRNSTANTNYKWQATSATARPGKTYYIPEAVSALDISNYADGELSVERLEVDANGSLVMRNGEVHRVSSSAGNSRRRRRGRGRYYNPGTRSGQFFKYVSPNGHARYFKTGTGGFPSVVLQRNTPVQYIKPFFGFARSDGSEAEENLAMIKQGDRTLLVKFPLYTREHGATPTEPDEPNVMPPVKTSSPHREREPAAPRDPNAPPPVPRGPKTTYKIYGKHRGAPAHTRLKGQAYIAPRDTQFRNGEQAVLTPDDGKLKVKKPDGDHTQTWEPSDG